MVTLHHFRPQLGCISSEQKSARMELAKLADTLFSVMYRKAEGLHFVGTICYNAVAGNLPGNKTGGNQSSDGIKE